MKIGIVLLLLFTTIVGTITEASDYSSESQGHSTVKIEITDNGGNSVDVEPDIDGPTVIPPQISEPSESIDDTEKNKNTSSENSGTLFPSTGEFISENIVLLGIIVLFLAYLVNKKTRNKK